MAAGYQPNNLRLAVPAGIDNSLAGAIWQYLSPTDSAATVAGSGYFTDGQAKGMQVGDLVIVYDVTNTIVKSGQVLSINATTGAASLNATLTTIGGAS